MSPQFGHGWRLTWSHFPRNYSHLQSGDETLGRNKTRDEWMTMSVCAQAALGWKMLNLSSYTVYAHDSVLVSQAYVHKQYESTQTRAGYGQGPHDTRNTMVHLIVITMYWYTQQNLLKTYK